MEDEYYGAEAFVEAGGVKDHDRKSEGLSEPVSVAAFKDRCRQLNVVRDCLPGASREELAARMGLEEQEYMAVEEACKISNLMVRLLV